MNPIIQKTYDEVRNLFIYVSDSVQFPKVYDNWKSYTDEVEQGIVFKDDCDAMALTCAELLIRRGIPAELVRLAFCHTEMGEGHLVCIADGYLLDNRQRHIWKWDQVQYDWVSSMRMSDPGKWRKFEISTV